MKIALALLVLASIASCSDDTGQPDPPVQQLVPCHRDAGPDDPLACPPPSDAGVDAR